MLHDVKLADAFQIVDNDCPPGDYHEPRNALIWAGPFSYSGWAKHTFGPCRENFGSMKIVRLRLTDKCAT